MVIPFSWDSVRSRLGLDFAQDNETKYRYALFAGGRGMPLPILSNVSTNVAYLPAAARRRVDEERPDHALSIVIFATI